MLVSICFGVSCLMSIRSCIRFSGRFIGSLRVCILNSFSKIKSLASSSDKNSTGGFVVFFSVVLFPRPVSLPGGLASWTLYRLKGYLRRFLSSSSSLRSVFLELFVAAFRLAMSNSSNFLGGFFSSVSALNS